MFTSINNTIAVLDVGSSKIASLILQRSSSGFEILGVGNCASAGIEHGVIRDAKLARSAIACSVYEAEKMAKRNVDTVIVNVSNSLIKSNLITIQTNFGGNQILPADLKKIRSIVFDKIDLSKNEVLSYKILKHDLDEMKAVSDPEFMFANILTSYVHIVTVPVKYLIGIGSCLLGCQLKVGEFMLSSEAAGNSCLSEEEMAEGCVLIDIGAGSADYAVYRDKQIIECGTIPFGGIDITRDIASYFSIKFDEAEKLKTLYGELKNLRTEERKNIEIKRHEAKDNKQIDAAILNKVIIARVSEILGFVIQRVKEKKQSRACLNKIIFTGGSSKLVGLVSFVEEKFKIPARAGMPDNIIIENGFSRDPIFSTAMGLIGGSNFEEEQKFFKHGTSKFKKALIWLKQNF